MVFGRIGTFVTKVLVVLSVAFVPLPATGHGFLAEPKSRNLIAHNKGVEYDHMSLAGGGPYAVWPNGRWEFGGKGNHYTCGRKQYDVPGPVQSVWSPEQTVTFTITYTAVHRGHNYFGLCPSNQKPTPACFAKHWLRNAETGKLYWDLGSRGIGTYKMKFKLPKNFECPKCVLWWWWVTGNSCHPPGDNGDMRKCGEPGAVPEEFWNCADVSIVNKKVPSPKTGPKPIPSPKPRPSPKPGPKPIQSPKPACPSTLYGTDQQTFFFICAHGNPVKIPCPKGTLWNTDKSICDWPKRAS